jgi:amino acid transporter
LGISHQWFLKKMSFSLKSLLLGRARSLADRNLFHQVSLIAVFAWVGLGSDGLSSSCYGPEETFRALGSHHPLAVFVALASVLTIVAICASYSQIISLFPNGGGGYLVASKLLSPAAGVVSGSALLIDYVLTITISVASGADALFSLLPADWHVWKLAFALGGVAALTLVNLRGVRESVLLFVPVFTLFVLTHAFVIVYALARHAPDLPAVAASTVHEVRSVSAEVGWLGLLALLLKAYSMGAGTYTGIEAVSNGLPILREPRVRTGRRTMLYMGVSLALTVGGLLLAYLLYGVEHQPGKTLNAVLFESLAAGWSPTTAQGFIITTLAAEAALLLIAAQAGFLDGPRVLASMALDRWFPARFAHLSDRFVAQNGILLMGGCALVMMLVARGSVGLLVVLYSINVFITFTLSQLGMVRHWWNERHADPAWRRKIVVNGFGLALTSFILVSLVVLKFHDGGWATLLVTGLLVAAAFAIKRHYTRVGHQLRQLDSVLPPASAPSQSALPAPDSIPPAPCSPLLAPCSSARTAIVLVNGFNGLGLHTVLNVPRLFGDGFKNLVFLHVGQVDAGNFKGAAEIDALRAHAASSAECYVNWAAARGIASKAFTAIGQDLPDEIMRLARSAADEFPRHVFFAGQLSFARETRLTRWLHNHSVFELQRRFVQAGRPFVILPVRLPA